MHHLNKTVYKVAFFALVLLLMLSPVLPEILMEIFTFLKLNDKMEHFIAFFVLSFLLNRASSTVTHRIRNVIALLLFGIMIEFIQYFVPNRSASRYDVLANFMGIVMFQFSFSTYLYFKGKKKTSIE